MGAHASSLRSRMALWGEGEVKRKGNVLVAYGFQFLLGRRQLVGFITGIPATMDVRGDELRTVEINFLCVHKKLR